MVSCQKDPTRHAYAWQIGPFWQDTLDITMYRSGFLTKQNLPWVWIRVEKWDQLARWYVCVEFVILGLTVLYASVAIDERADIYSTGFEDSPTHRDPLGLPWKAA